MSRPTSFGYVPCFAPEDRVADAALLQVSVGIEHIKDIIADFDEALKAVL